jgi:hypothetical protein
LCERDLGLARIHSTGPGKSTTSCMIIMIISALKFKSKGSNFDDF